MSAAPWRVYSRALSTMSAGSSASACSRALSVHDVSRLLGECFRLLGECARLHLHVTLPPRSLFDSCIARLRVTSPPRSLFDCCIARLRVTSPPRSLFDCCVLLLVVASLVLVLVPGTPLYGPCRGAVYPPSADSLMMPLMPCCRPHPRPRPRPCPRPRRPRHRRPLRPVVVLMMLLL